MTYEYRCNSCNHQWEKEQKISDNAITTCPKCASNSAKRLISCGTGFILKGRGWAKDNYSK